MMDPLDNLQTRIEEVAQASTALRSISAQLRKPGADPFNIGRQVQREEEKAKRAIKAANEIVQKKIRETGNSQNRIRFEKLSRELTTHIKGYDQEIKVVLGLLRDKQQRLAIQEDIESQQASSSSRGSSSDLIEPLIAKRSSQVTSLELELQNEKLESISELNKDLEELNKLFIDMGILVKHQGEMLETIESEIGQTAIKVSTGVEELNKAKQHQKSARKKMFCIICCLVIGLAVLFGFLGGFKMLG